MPYWRLYYHVVWGTRDREPLLVAEVHESLERAIRATLQDQRSLVHAVGIMPDHVHVAFSAPPTMTLSTLIGRVKGLTSHLINSLARSNAQSTFAWQGDYGVLSFSEKALPQVVDYVDNQPARHAAGKLWLPLEQTEPDAARSQPPSGGFVG